MKSLRLWTKRHTRQAADGTEMFSVSGTKGKTRLHRCGCDQSIGQLNAVGESVLFDKSECCYTDGFGEGQDSKLELAKRLLYLARLQPGSGTLKKLHEGDNGQGAFWCCVDDAGRPFVAACRLNQNIGIEDQFDLRKRGSLPLLA